jgi:copper chaperone NosL
MGADEAVPFSDKNAAETFATENGGRVMAFADVPKDYVLGATAETTSSVEDGHGGHAAPAAPKDAHAH